MSFDYITEAEALHLAQAEGFVVADLGLLASAIARPQTTVFGIEPYLDLWTKAAALMESLARNQALVDGNKRLALMLTDLFLALNGWDLTDAPEHVDYVLAVCTGRLDLDASAAHLRRYSVPMGDDDRLGYLTRPA